MDANTGFLIFSLFFPRLTILFSHWHWFGGSMPLHTTIAGWWACWWMTLLLPRIFILTILVDNGMVNTPWFYIHLIVMLLVWLASILKQTNKS